MARITLRPTRAAGIRWFAILAARLLTVLVTAALLRFGLYSIYSAYFAFPWNQVVYAGFMGFCLAVTLVIIPRPGIVVLWTAAWMFFDYVFQGGALAYLLGYIPVPVLTELSFSLMRRWGGDFRSLLVGTMVYQAGHATWTWIAYNEIWFTPPYPLLTFLQVAPAALFVGNSLGVALGYILVRQVEQLARLRTAFGRVAS